MGKTWGGTFALTGPSNGGAVLAVSGSTCYGMGFSTTICPTTVTAGQNTYLLRVSDGAVVSTDQRIYSRKSLLFGATIPNDVPPPPTTLDSDDDGFDETVLIPELDGHVRRWTLKAGASPTLASVDTTKSITIFDASGSKCADSTIACEPIGSPVTIVRNIKNSTFGAYVVTGGADWAREPAASYVFHVYGFDPKATATTTAYSTSTLPSITPPLSSAPGRWSDSRVWPSSCAATRR